MVRFLGYIKTAFLIVALCFFSQSSLAGDALLIGVSNYKIDPLRNPVNDANLIANSLEKKGWNVVVLENPSSIALKSKVKKFMKRNKGGRDPILIYFSGHGFQYYGENYLVGIKEGGYPTKLTDLSLSISELNSYSLGVKRPRIIIVDACRNASFGANTLSPSAGLNSQFAPPNTLIAYATSPGKFALDGPSDGNSPYAESLSLSISQFFRVEDIFRNTRLKTMLVTNGRQIPWESSSLVYKVSFNRNSTVSSLGNSESTSVSKIEGAGTLVPEVRESAPVISSLNEAIKYLIKLAKEAPRESFIEERTPHYNHISERRLEVSQNTEELRSDVVESLVWLSKRNMNAYVRNPYSMISHAFRYGSYLPSQRDKDGFLNHDLSRSSYRIFTFQPDVRISFLVAEEAHKKGVSTSEYAKHFQYGQGVTRDLVRAYDLYKELDKKEPGYYWSEINRMVQEVLESLGEDLLVDGDFGPRSCSALRKRIGPVACGKTVSRNNVVKLMSSVSKDW